MPSALFGTTTPAYGAVHRHSDKPRFAQPGHHFRRELKLSASDVLIAQHQNFQHGKHLLSFFKRCHILPQETGVPEGMGHHLSRSLRNPSV